MAYDETNVPAKRLRFQGLRRVAVEKGTGNVLMSFSDEAGGEQWLQVPAHAVGPMIMLAMEALKNAPERHLVPTPGEHVVRSFYDGMRAKDFTLGVSDDGESATLSLTTVAGLSFEFLVPAAAIPELRVGLRQIESALNQRKRPRGGKPH